MMIVSTSSYWCFVRLSEDTHILSHHILYTLIDVTISEQSFFMRHNERKYTFRNLSFFLCSHRYNSWHLNWDTKKRGHERDKDQDEKEREQIKRESRQEWRRAIDTKGKDKEEKVAERGKS